MKSYHSVRLLKNRTDAARNLSTQINNITTTTTTTIKSINDPHNSNHHWRNLISSGSLKDLENEIRKNAKELNLQQKSFTMLIPKIFTRSKEFDIAYTLLEMFQDDSKMNENNSFLVIGAAQIVSECLASNLSLKHIWKCYERLLRMNGRLDMVTYQKLLQLCASKNETKKLIILIKNHQVTESALVLASEPLIMSGHVIEFTQLFKKFLDGKRQQQHSKESLSTKNNSIVRVLSSVYFAHLKRSLASAEFSSSEISGVFDFMKSIRSFLDKLDRKDLLSFYSTNVLYGRLRKLYIESLHSNGIKNINPNLLHSHKVKLEVTGFPYLTEDREGIPEELEESVNDLSAQHKSVRDTPSSLLMFSTKFFPDANEELLTRHGLESRAYDYAREYYGPNVPFKNSIPHEMSLRSFFRPAARVTPEEDENDLNGNATFDDFDENDDDDDNTAVVAVEASVDEVEDEDDDDDDDDEEFDDDDDDEDDEDDEEDDGDSGDERNDDVFVKVGMSSDMDMVMSMGVAGSRGQSFGSSSQLSRIMKSLGLQQSLSKFSIPDDEAMSALADLDTDAGRQAQAAEFPFRDVTYWLKRRFRYGSVRFSNDFFDDAAQGFIEGSTISIEDDLMDEDRMQLTDEIDKLTEDLFPTDGPDDSGKGIRSGGGISKGVSSLPILPTPKKTSGDDSVDHPDR